MVSEEKPKNVLVVDDEPIIRQAMKMILRFDGHKTELASSAEDAFAALDLQSFDIIFLDFQMPGVTGDAVAHCIKTKDPKKPVVFITGHLPRPHSPDVDMVIDKPFSIQDIRSAITRLT
jgi:CheY-like chemotaxis protein